MKKIIIFLAFFAIAFGLEDLSNKLVNIVDTLNDGKNSQKFGLNTFFEKNYNPKYLGLSTKDFYKKLGSGIIIDPNGYILTNYHMIRGVKKLAVIIGSKEVPAKIINFDNENDLVVLKVPKENLEFFSYTSGDTFNLNEQVSVLGKPFDDKLFASKANISYTTLNQALDSRYQYIIAQGTQRVNGAAVLGKTNKLIGIVNLKNTLDLGMNGFFVITPLDVIRKSVSKILAREDKEEVWFGLFISALEPKDVEFYKRKKGVVIISVEENSPAFKAGLQKGDLLIAIDDSPIDTPEDLDYKIASMHPGDEKIIEFQRDFKTQEAVIKLVAPIGYASPTQEQSINGLVLEPLSQKLRRSIGIPRDLNGVVISNILSGSVASKAGFLTGDVIIRVEQKQVNTIDVFRVLLEPKPQNITVFRKGVIVNILWRKNE